MYRGYLKLWRCTLDTDIWSNEALWRLWSWCLLKATYKERWVSISTGKGELSVKLLPGQFVFGRKTAAKELKWTESTLYKRLQKLKTLGNCNIESNTHYSIITICKWSIYQPEEIKSKQAKEQASNTQVTGKEHKQEGKEGKEVKDILSSNGPDNGEDPPLKVNGIPYKEIILYLNQKANTFFKFNTKATRRQIKARFNEGNTVDDFKKVIDLKVDEWAGDDKMNQYLRPQTLFSTKFESYLSAAKQLDSNGGNYKKLTLPPPPEELIRQKLQKGARNENV